MKLLRLGPVGHERPAVLADDDRLLDASALVHDWSGSTLDPATLDRVRAALADLPEIPTDERRGLRVGAPVARPGSVVCIGLNYAAHAAESGAAVPTEPVVFLKVTNTVIGPDDTVLVPRGSTRTDYEVELAVVIGTTARYFDSAADGLACVAGYAISNDVSEREFQLDRGGQWDKGKGCETFNPLGPWLVTADEVPDPQALDLQLSVNGSVRQQSNTSDMIFGVGEIIRYLSHFMVLEPGDVINTGTPAGVALGHPDPKPYLKAGDVMSLEIAGLGRQHQQVGQA